MDGKTKGWPTTMAEPGAPFTTHLTMKIARAADVVSFRFERPPGHDYRPGQWAVLTIPGPEGTLTHHFTYSSSPTEPWLEMTTRLRGTPYKNALDALPMGTEVTMAGPNGFFTLRDEVPRAAFLAGGIGITTVRSILRALADRGDERPLLLLYGNRDEDGIAFGDELLDLSAALPGLRVVHVLSDAGPTWSGDRGFIDAALVQREAGPVADWRFYLSGPPPMVESLRTMLADLGVPREGISTEEYLGY
jgi:ferredoxin-NADP reductase